MPINLYITFTTLPSYVDKLDNFVDNLTKQTLEPTKILFAICDQYKRDNKELVLPDFIKRNQKIQILKIDDCGPITRLLAAIKYITKIKEDKPTNIQTKNYIIVINDDYKYPEKLFYYLVQNMKMDESSVYGFNGQIIGLFETQNNEIKKNKSVNVINNSYGVIYDYDMFDKDFFTYITNTINNNDYCKYNDDIIISNYLAKKNISRKILNYHDCNQQLICNNAYNYRNDQKRLHLLQLNTYEFYKKNIFAYDYLINKNIYYFNDDTINNFKKILKQTKDNIDKEIKK